MYYNIIILQYYNIIVKRNVALNASDKSISTRQLRAPKPKDTREPPAAPRPHPTGRAPATSETHILPSAGTQSQRDIINLAHTHSTKHAIRRPDMASGKSQLNTTPSRPRGGA